MNKLFKYLFYFSLFSIVTGVVFKLPIDIPGVNIYLFDIAACLTFILCLINYRNIKKLFIKDKITPVFVLFIVVSIFSLIFSPISLTSAERLVSSLYIVRFVTYYSIYLSTVYLLHEKIFNREKIIRCLSITGITLSVIGWLQYFLYPDLRNLFYMGWDPHYKRIFSSIFDPNYLGLILTLTIIALFEYKKSYILIWISRIFVFLTLLFTYSRSSYLSLLASSIFYSLMRKRLAIFLLVFLAFVSTIFFLPRPSGEGVKLERIFSINERVTSMSEGIRIFTVHPVTGIGFNTLRYAKQLYGISQNNGIDNHSSAGIENSFIFVLATTGFIGFVVYLFLILKIFAGGSDFVKVSFAAIFVHSLFLNSLFFPPVLIWMWIIAAWKKDSFKDYR